MRIAPLLLCCALAVTKPLFAQRAELERVAVAKHGEGMEGMSDWQTRLTLRLQPEGEGSVKNVAVKQSSVTEATNHATGQPVEVSADFSEYHSETGEGGSITTDVGITTRKEIQRMWLKVTGVVALDTIVETEKHKARIPFKEGSSLKVGDLKLVVKNLKVREDSNLRLFTLECAGPMEAIADIHFTDTDGKPVETSRSGSSRTTTGGQVTEESWTFSCPGSYEELEAEFEFVKRMETKEIPFDVVIPVNP